MVVELNPGDEAPDFELENDVGEPVRLSDYRGQPVVLYFYPKDDTPGCTKEACGFRDSYESYTDKDAVILGVSPDPVDSHAKFRMKYKLPFELLSDPDHGVAAAYGVWGPKKMYGREYEGILRTTFVIDGEGKVAHVFRGVKPDGHWEEVLSVVPAAVPAEGEEA